MVYSDRDIKILLHALSDRPVEKRENLVNRKDAIDRLNVYTRYAMSGVYGLCGEKGVGKTSVLNVVASESRAIMLSITEKEDKLTILFDMLYRMAKAMNNLGINDKLAQEVMDFVVSKREYIRSKTVGLSTVIEASIDDTDSITDRMPHYKIYEYMDNILASLVNALDSVAIIVDELDKEDKKDVLIILDSIKHVIRRDNVVVILSMPTSIYAEFVNDKMAGSNANLDNILNDVVFLPPMSDEEIKEIIKSRIDPYVDFFDDKALDYITLYSEGNPRSALWVATRLIMDNISAAHNGINGKIAYQSIHNMVREFSKVMEIMSWEEEILRILSTHDGIDRDKLIEMMTTVNRKLSTIKSYISRAKKKGYIEEVDGKLRLRGKWRFFA